MTTTAFFNEVNMGSKAVYLHTLFWILWTVKISLSNIPDPCPDIKPSTQVTDMCQSSSAFEHIGVMKEGNYTFDHVTLRATTQTDNCTCLVNVENQSSDSIQMNIQPYMQLDGSAPKTPLCGLVLYVDFYQMEQQQINMFPIKCTSGQHGSSISFFKNSVLRFTSKVIGGNLTRGYCIDIQTEHVAGHNGTLKIVCEVPGVTPNLLTAPTDPSTGQPTSVKEYTTSSDDSAVYIAAGSGAGVLVIATVTLAVLFCKRQRSIKKEPPSADNINMQYDNLSESRNTLDYSTLNRTTADDQQYEIVS